MFDLIWPLLIFLYGVGSILYLNYPKSSNKTFKFRIPEHGFNSKVKRAAARIEKCSESLARLTTVVLNDEHYKEVVVSFAEFGTGGVGIYVACEEEEEDSWFQITKKHLDVFEEVIKRAKTR